MRPHGATRGPLEGHPEVTLGPLGGHTGAAPRHPETARGPRPPRRYSSRRQLPSAVVPIVTRVAGSHQLQMPVTLPFVSPQSRSEISQLAAAAGCTLRQGVTLRWKFAEIGDLRPARGDSCAQLCLPRSQLQAVIGTGNRQFLRRSIG